MRRNKKRKSSHRDRESKVVRKSSRKIPPPTTTIAQISLPTPLYKATARRTKSSATVTVQQADHHSEHSLDMLTTQSSRNALEVTPQHGCVIDYFTKAYPNEENIGKSVFAEIDRVYNKTLQNNNNNDFCLNLSLQLTQPTENMKPKHARQLEWFIRKANRSFQMLHITNSIINFNFESFNRNKFVAQNDFLLPRQSMLDQHDSGNVGFGYSDQSQINISLFKDDNVADNFSVTDCKKTWMSPNDEFNFLSVNNALSPSDLELDYGRKCRKRLCCSNNPWGAYLEDCIQQLPQLPQVDLTSNLASNECSNVTEYEPLLFPTFPELKEPSPLKFYPRKVV